MNSGQIVFVPGAPEHRNGANVQAQPKSKLPSLSGVAAYAASRPWTWAGGDVASIALKGSRIR